MSRTGTLVRQTIQAPALLNQSAKARSLSALGAAMYWLAVGSASASVLRVCCWGVDRAAWDCAANRPPRRAAKISGMIFMALGIDVQRSRESDREVTAGAGHCAPKIHEVAQDVRRRRAHGQVDDAAHCGERCRR